MDLVKKTGDSARLPPILLVNDFDEFFSRRRFRRKFDHQLAAAGNNSFLIQGIKGLLAFLPDVDQPCLAQNGEMMGDGRLRETNFFHDLVYRQPTAAALAHDLLTSLIGDSFGKKDSIYFH